MKVYIITREAFPNGMASVSRIKNYARAIKEGGVDCEVLIIRRTEPYGTIPHNTIWKGELDGIPFMYVSKNTMRRSNSIIRQLDDWLDLRKTESYLRKNLSSADVVFFYLNRVDIELNILKLAHSKGAKCVRELCELPYGTGDETSRAIKQRKRTFDVEFPLLDGIVSISDSLLKLAQSHTTVCKHIKVPILVDFNRFKLPNQSEISEVPFIFHAGTLYEQKDGILGIIEAFGIAKKKIGKPVKFVATGKLEGTKHEADIRHLITKYQLETYIQFLGYVSDSELKDYLTKASMVIINKNRTQQNTFCFSTKLGEYLAAAKPVIITRVGEANNWLDNGKSAYMVEPENIEDLANAIEHVFTHPDESRKVGLAGQEVCRKCFDYRNWSIPLVEFLNSLGK